MHAALFSYLTPLLSLGLLSLVCKVSVLIENFSTSSHLKSHWTNFPQITFYILQGLFYSTIPFSAFQVLSVDGRCY